MRIRNRLRLDWGISSIKERQQFIQTYLEDEIFSKRPPSERELEQMGDYILYGKDEDGKNMEQRKEIQIEGKKNSSWVKKKAESLDSLLENPAFNEGSLQQSETPFYSKKEKFSREKALEEAPPHLQKEFVDLFNRIDRVDLTISFYEIEKGKRKDPPRGELLKRLKPNEIETCREEASGLSPQNYLKLRHLLVSLRTQQYETRDLYKPTIQKRSLSTPQFSAPSSFYFDSDLEVYPLGLFSNSQLSKLLFPFPDSFNPSTYSEEELQKVSSFIWKKENLFKKNLEKEKDFFDFRELEHVYNLFLFFFELSFSDNSDVDSTTNDLIRTLLFYTFAADLSPVQREILSLKIQKVKNKEISQIINKKFNKTYTDNYISTIFRQKIIKEINIAAEQHLLAIQDIFFPENFKTCAGTCRRVLRRDAYNFVRKSRSKDGFSNRCKRCDKEEREKKKILKKGGTN